jgi:4-hydroxy-tetrahydrodipicolinate synthase
MFHGSMVAIITPMHENGAVDFNSMSDLIEWHIDNGTQALVVLGTTGEFATLNSIEREEVLKFAIEQTRDRIPIIAGSGTNSTSETIKLTRHAMEVGADACLLVTPYYNKPTQEGMFQHYSAVANSVAIPLILYNVPSRTGCDLLPETVCRLSKFTNIVGLKEATGDITRVEKILKGSSSTIDLYSGDDISALDFILAGGKGVISVTANVAPRLMHELCTAALNGEIEKAKELQNKLMPLHKQLFIESNPIPVKWALQEMGKIDRGIRLPLTTLASTYHEELRAVLKQTGVI